MMRALIAAGRREDGAWCDNAPGAGGSTLTLDRTVINISLRESLNRNPIKGFILCLDSDRQS